MGGAARREPAGASGGSELRERRDRRERREGREHAPNERRGGRRGEGVVLAHYRQQCPGGGGQSWATRAAVRASLSSRGSGGIGASFEAREERASGGRLACGDALPAWSLQRGQGAARTESGKNGEQRGRRAARTETPRRAARTERAARMESGEDEERRERRERRDSFDATRRRDLRWRMGEGGGK